MTYVTLIDGYAYSISGITGTLFTDAAIGITACIAAAILLARFDSRRTEMSPLMQPEAAREET